MHDDILTSLTKIGKLKVISHTSVMQYRGAAGYVEPPADEAPSNWINAGTYVLEPSVLDRIPGGRKVSIERETFPAMVTEIGRAHV